MNTILCPYVKKGGRKILEGQSNSQIKNKLTTPWLKIKGKQTNNSPEDTPQKTKE